VGLEYTGKTLKGTAKQYSNIHHIQGSHTLLKYMNGFPLFIALLSVFYLTQWSKYFLLHFIYHNGHIMYIL